MMHTSQHEPANDVDRYLAALPEPARTTLAHLRQAIRDCVPEADELISSQIPTYRLHGPLVAFAAFKQHCGFYLMSPSVMAACSDALRAYDTATTTLRFPVDQPLPVALVTKLVTARLVENTTKAKKISTRVRPSQRT